MAGGAREGVRLGEHRAGRADYPSHGLLLTDWRLRVHHDTLRLRTGLIEGPVTRLAGDRLRSEVGALTFERDAEGAITGVRIFNRGVRGLRLARISGEP